MTNQQSHDLWDPTAVARMGGPSYEVLVLGAAIAATPGTIFSVFDMGCGDGRNAFMLAGAGASVCALDRSASDLAFLRALAEVHSRTVHTVQSEATKYVFTDEYDVFLSHGLLHFLARDDAQRLVNRSKRHTRPGGYHVYTVSHFGTEAEIIPDFRRQGHTNSIDSSQICSLFADWDLVLSDDYIKWDAHPAGVRHVHPISKLIFRKPGGAPKLEATKILLSRSPSEEKVQHWLAAGDRIGAKESELKTAVGEQDAEIVAFAPGGQFGFERIESRGYCLRLQFFGRLMIYISNGVISGIARHKRHFTKLSPV